MRLSKLVLSGFKSFAKNTTLEFPASISAIVGPNGSGKSNVVESIAWVLGEQSIKYLRGKKGEDLIFNGSVTAPKMGKASVSLVFSGKDKNDAAGEETALSRTVYRDGQNEYFINEVRSRLKDTIELLSKFGLGASRHHIINQGEADRILTVSFKERREMVEDALGLRIYQLKREESLRKLERTRDNINQAESLKKEIQPHLKFLKKQVEKARQVFVLQDKLRILYSSWLAKFERQNKRDAENIKLRKQETESSISIIERGIREIREKLEIFSKDKEKIQKVREEVNRLEREMGRYEGMFSQKKIQPSPEIGAKKEIRVTIDFKKAESFLFNIEEKLDRALSEVEIESVKNILGEMKESIALFIKEYQERVHKKEETGALAGAQEQGDALQKKYDELATLLRLAKEEEIRLYDENEKTRETEKELYQKEIQVNELRSKLREVLAEENNVKLRDDELLREKTEARALLKEDLTFQSADEFAYGDLEGEKREIERLKIKLEESGGVGEEILKEFKEVQARDEFLGSELSDLQKTADSLKDLAKQLEDKLTDDFKAGVLKINDEFQKFFEIMFGGGSASLKITNSKDENMGINNLIGEDSLGEEAEKEPEVGLEISVSLPRKRIKSLDMLSGGERALTSIALLFAVSQVNPPPFLVLDETDAALDEANSRKYAAMLKDLSRRTQLILITHNRETMNVAGILYGVTMGSDGISRLLSVKLEEAEGYAR